MIGSICEAKAKAERLGVFLPNVYSVKKLEESIRKDPVFSGFKVDVYGRVKDLLAIHKKDPYDVVIAPSPVSKLFAGMDSSLQFHQNGSNKRKLVVVSVDSKWDRSRFKKGAIVAIDQTGDRKTAKEYIKNILRIKFLRVKLVNKGADLFPMLSLGNANYMLIDEVDLTNLTKTTDFNFTVVHSIVDDNPKVLVKSNDLSLIKRLSGISLQAFLDHGYQKAEGDK